jgi:hypothetical protein
MGLNISNIPFNQSASVQANTTTDQARTTNAIIQNQNALRFDVKQASVVVAPNGQVVSTFNA